MRMFAVAAIVALLVTTPAEAQKNFAKHARGTTVHTQDAEYGALCASEPVCAYVRASYKDGVPRIYYYVVSFPSGAAIVPLVDEQIDPSAFVFTEGGAHVTLPGVALTWSPNGFTRDDLTQDLIHTAGGVTVRTVTKELSQAATISGTIHGIPITSQRATMLDRTVTTR